MYRMCRSHSVNARNCVEGIEQREWCQEMNELRKRKLNICKLL